jgi:hypothetical protein
MSSSVTSSRRNDPSFWAACSSAFLATTAFSSSGSLPKRQLGGAVQVAAALGQLQLGLGRLDVGLELPGSRR